MQQPNIVSRIGAWLLLFARGATWAAWPPYAALLIAANYAINEVFARRDLLPSFGLYIFGIGQLQNLVWIAVALFLSRRLGGEAPLTAWIRGALWVVAYLLLRQYVPALVIALVVLVSGSMADIGSISSGIGLLVSFALFPFVIRLVAVAHSANDLRLRAIWAYLMRDGSSLYMLFIAVDVAAFLLDLGVNRLMGSDTPDLLLLQAFNALRGIMLILFYIMAYREIRAAQSPSPAAFA